MILTDMWSTMIKEHWSVLTYVHILSSDNSIAVYTYMSIKWGTK